MGSQSHTDPAIGPRRLGRFELIAKIAAGGMAEVFLARQHGFGGFQKVVVVKTIHEHLAEQQSFIDMFLDEARVSALIKHHNVVDIFDLGEDDGTFFIAMEYIPGQALSKVMSLCQRTEPLDTMMAVDIIASAANGLDAAHDLENIAGEPLHLVHRDVSPGNILVSYNGAVKLVDFGVAKSLGSISTSQASVLKGKIGYASPEQLEDRPIDRRSDVFSLGIVLWELLVLERLFRAGSAGATVKKILECAPSPPSSRRPEVPAALDEICLKALARDPDDRYQSAGEMRAALVGVLQSHNYHADEENIARFMRASFAAERARERTLITEIGETYDDDDDDVEIEIQPARSRRRSQPPLVTGIVAELDPDELVPDEGDVESDDVVAPEPDAVMVELEAPTVSEVTAKTAPIGPRVQRARVVIAGAVAAVVLIIAVIAATGGDTPESKAGESAADKVPAIEPEPEPAPEPEPVGVVAADAAPAVEADAAPRDPELERAARLVERGEAAFNARDTKRAKRLFREALELREDYAPALRGLAEVYTRVGRGKQARYYLHKYLRAAPDAPDAASLRRRVYSSTR